MGCSLYQIKKYFVSFRGQNKKKPLRSSTAEKFITPNSQHFPQKGFHVESLHRHEDHFLFFFRVLPLGHLSGRQSFTRGTGYE